MWTAAPQSTGRSQALLASCLVEISDSAAQTLSYIEGNPSVETSPMTSLSITKS